MAVISTSGMRLKDCRVDYSPCDAAGRARLRSARAGPVRFCKRIRMKRDFSEPSQSVLTGV